MNTNPDQQALQSHLNTIKARTLAWVAEDPANRWATYPVTDLDHWASIGITTVAQYEHYSLVCEVFEACKETMGYKPDWYALNARSDEDLRRELHRYARLSKAFQEHRQEQEAERQRLEAKALEPAPAFTLGDVADWPSGN